MVTEVGEDVYLLQGFVLQDGLNPLADAVLNEQDCFSWAKLVKLDVLFVDVTVD